MSAVSTTCMITDAPPEQDRRVQAAMFGRQEVRLVNLGSFQRADSGLVTSFVAVCVLLRAILAAVPLIPKLRAFLSPYPHHGPFAGLSAAWRWTRAAVACHRDLSSSSTLYANDLYCATAAVIAASSDVRIIYDSHEIQFHRNRKTGWLRILIEAGLEQMVMKRADELYVVSEGIACLMKRLYGKLPHTRVIYNDFYSHHDVSPTPFNAPPVFVYVGRGLSGRMLEVLDRPLVELGTELYFYPLGSALPPHLSGKYWNLGPEEYEQDLLKLVRSRRCLMWCCIENQCLSYSYALPNKFFQALAVGMPVIARRGTYLADLVEKHGLGLVFEESGALDHLIETARGPLFQEWRRNILRFRKLLRDGSVLI